MKDYVITFTIDMANSTIRVEDNRGTDCVAKGYMVIVGMGDENNDLITAFGDSEAVAQAFANAYGTAHINQDKTSGQIRTLLNKCINYARKVAAQLPTVIGPKEALDKFEADICKCTGDAGCICKHKKTWN